MATALNPELDLDRSERLPTKCHKIDAITNKL
jgi:hypothetical protein